MAFELTLENWKLMVQLITDQQAQIEALKSELLRVGALKGSEFESALERERRDAAARIAPGIGLLDALASFRKKE
jgi:hypothetical protein